MLSLDILSGKGNQTKKPEAKPKLTIIRPPGKEQPLEKVVVDLQVCGPEHVGTTKKVKNKEVEDVFMSIPGNKMGKYYLINILFYYHYYFIFINILFYHHYHFYFIRFILILLLKLIFCFRSL